MLPSLLPSTTTLRLILGWAAVMTFSSQAQAWWSEEWSVRKKITIDTSDKGVAITDTIGGAEVLIRLSDNNFNFEAVKEDGSDIRFIAQDDKTVLKHHIEKMDSLLHEGYVWVQVPELKPGAANTIWLYYGSQSPKAVKAEDAKGTFAADTVLAFHFGENGSAPVDSSSGGSKCENSGVPAPGSLIANGLRLTGQTAVTVSATPSMEWAEGGALTWSAWVKPSNLAPNAVIFSRREGSAAFVVGLNNGAPYVHIGAQQSADGTPISVGVWHHVSVVASGATTTVYLDGKSYGTIAAGIPALKGTSLIGKDSGGEGKAAPGFTGEIDELHIAKAARPVGYLRFAAVNQGTGADAGKLLVAGADEASAANEQGELAKQVTLIKDISKDLTLDGWVVIVLCGALAVIGWGVAIAKLLYLNKIGKATKEFLKRWESVATDLTALDQSNEESIKTMGGTVNAKAQRLMRHSPMYHIYHLGSEEIRNRLKSPTNTKGLSGRSIQAIKASLHSGLMREVQKLNSQLVFLTIGIAGGPYLGLLGTVIGVMITFAVIAKSGQVEVNSIAPGIAGALLATVAGLAVAIPALFAYSYLSSRIKDVVTDMETFIDEFIAKMAEHHKEGGN